MKVATWLAAFSGLIVLALMVAHFRFQVGMSTKSHDDEFQTSTVPAVEHTSATKDLENPPASVRNQAVDVAKSLRPDAKRDVEAARLEALPRVDNNAKVSDLGQWLIETAASARSTLHTIESIDPNDLLNAIAKGNADKALISQLQSATRLALTSPGNRMIPKATMSALKRFRADELMEKPTVEIINGGKFDGDLVYYVNGMNTPLSAAQSEARALSMQLKRPIGLIYSPTASTDGNAGTGIALDIAGATYDRAWPFLPPIQHQPQANPTTRQVAYLLHHSKDNVAIVSHSRGCLIVRNALMIAEMFDTSKLLKRTAWISTGAPLHDEEIHAKPRQSSAIRNPGDPVSQTIGLQFNPDEFLEQNPDHHDFVKCYVPKVKTKEFEF